MFHMRHFLDGLSHWLRANTRHGTHSPFVYRLLDEVVYADRHVARTLSLPTLSSRTAQLLDRIIADYQPDHVLVVSSDLPQLLQPKSLVVLQDLPKGNPTLRLATLLGSVQPDTLLVIPQIYRNQVLKTCWKNLKQDPRVTVSIDLFHLGLVYFHQGQAKENFRIRY